MANNKQHEKLNDSRHHFEAWRMDVMVIVLIMIHGILEYFDL